MLFVVGVMASASMLALAGFGLGWFLSGRQIANLKDGPGSPPVVATPATTPDDTVAREDAVPQGDVSGKDFSDLPRYPGSVRVGYERRISETGLILSEAEYVSAAGPADVREFYRGVFRSRGWTVVDLGVSEGQWEYSVIRGKREAVIKIEPKGGSLEIEIDLSEPTRDGQDRHTNTAPHEGSRDASPAPYTPPAEDDSDYDDDFYDDGPDEGFEDD